MSNTGVAAMKWADNRNVHILSNFHDPNELDKVQRKQKDGSRKSYPCPTSIRDYNANINALDKFDQLMSSYKLDRRSRKWWHRIIFYFLDAAVINSYILNKQLNNNMPLKEFKGKCAEGCACAARTMVDVNTPTSSKLPIQISNSKPSVSVEIRKTSSSHLPERSAQLGDAVLSVVPRKMKFVIRGSVLYAKCHLAWEKICVSINIIHEHKLHGGTIYVPPYNHKLHGGTFYVPPYNKGLKLIFFCFSSIFRTIEFNHIQKHCC